MFSGKIKYRRWYEIRENPVEIREIFEIIGRPLLKIREFLRIPENSIRILGIFGIIVASSR
jgi:hypothetical protein